MPARAPRSPTAPANAPDPNTATTASHELPIEYRAAQARWLTEATTLPLAAIADATGFSHSAISSRKRHQRWQRPTSHDVEPSHPFPHPDLPTLFAQDGRPPPTIPPSTTAPGDRLAAMLEHQIVALHTVINQHHDDLDADGHARHLRLLSTAADSLTKLHRAQEEAMKGTASDDPRKKDLPPDPGKPPPLSGREADRRASLLRRFICQRLGIDPDARWSGHGRHTL